MNVRGVLLEKVSKPSSVREARDAIQAFERLLDSGLAPGIVPSLAALKACIKLKDLRAGARVHGEITKTGEISDVFVANTVVDMYSKCGSISDARRVFENIPRHSIVSWNSIIKGYAQRGKGEVALGLFVRMQERGFKPNAATFVSVLKACTSLASPSSSQIHSESRKSLTLDYLSKGEAIHNQIRSSGLEANLHVASSLVDMYSKCGDMNKAKQVFDSILHQDLVLWNSLIAGYAQAGDCEAALQAFSGMQGKGFSPNARTLTAALNACSGLATREEGRIVQGNLVKVSSLERGVAIHSQLMKFFEQDEGEFDIILASALLDMYVKCGSMVEAKRVFDQMPRHDVVSWTTLILGYAQSNEGEVALQLFSQMLTEAQVSPNELTFVAALEACIGMVSREEVLPELDRKRTCLERGRRIHSQLARSKQLESHPLVASTLVDMYSKCGSAADARKVFDRASNRDLLLWNAMIRGYSLCGEPELSLQIYSWMRDEGCAPVAQTFVSALKACGALADLQTGRRLHSHIRGAGFENEEVVANSLISFYGKCSSLQEAHQVFDVQKTRGLVTWNALMSGYAHHGDAKQVFVLFQRMLEERVHPSTITFTCILTACSHAGLVEKGKEYFDAMAREFGLTPTVEQYSCMVDILGRANHLQEALETVRTMPVKPSLPIWRSLLAASRKWRNVEIGRLAFDSIVAAEERDAAAYSVMASIYAAAGMREENLRIQNMRHNSRAWKQPGQSWWIDEKGLIHRFCAGDVSQHPQSSEIIEKLNEVVVKMKEAGYVPAVDMSEEEKENNVSRHSEKLAIGCALVNSEPGTTIYISKNLRACDDCHRATAIISKVEKRKVVCRDATRFHVFTDGVCSCGDFW